MWVNGRHTCYSRHARLPWDTSLNGLELDIPLHQTHVSRLLGTHVVIISCY